MEEDLELALAREETECVIIGEGADGNIDVFIPNDFEHPLEIGLAMPLKVSQIKNFRINRMAIVIALYIIGDIDLITVFSQCWGQVMIDPLYTASGGIDGISHRNQNVVTAHKCGLYPHGQLIGIEHPYPVSAHAVNIKFSAFLYSILLQPFQLIMLQGKDLDNLFRISVVVGGGAK